MKLKTSASAAAFHVALQPLNVELEELQASFVEDILIYIYKEKVAFSQFSLSPETCYETLNLLTFYTSLSVKMSPTLCRSAGDEIISLKPVVEY